MVLYIDTIKENDYADTLLCSQCVITNPMQLANH